MLALCCHIASQSKPRPPPRHSPQLTWTSSPLGVPSSAPITATVGTELPFTGCVDVCLPVNSREWLAGLSFVCDPEALKVVSSGTTCPLKILVRYPPRLEASTSNLCGAETVAFTDVEIVVRNCLDRAAVDFVCEALAPDEEVARLSARRCCSCPCIRLFVWLVQFDGVARAFKTVASSSAVSRYFWSGATRRVVRGLAPHQSHCIRL